MIFGTGENQTLPNHFTPEALKAANESNLAQPPDIHVLQPLPNWRIRHCHVTLHTAPTSPMIISDRQVDR